LLYAYYCEFKQHSVVEAINHWTVQSDLRRTCRNTRGFSAKWSCIFWLDGHE